MVSNSVNLGTVFLSESTFYDTNNDLIDPLTITFKYKKPDGVIGSSAGSYVSAGKYTASILLNQPGIWYCRWEGTGPAASANEFAIRVIDTRVQ